MKIKKNYPRQLLRVYIINSFSRKAVAGYLVIKCDQTSGIQAEPAVT